ncbi:hypothetical protein ACJQWK_04303 [Exserohilum turcicum]
MDHFSNDAMVTETNAALEQLIKKEIDRCSEALAVAHNEWKQTKQEEDEVFEAEQMALEEDHEREKAHERLHEDESKLLKALPTNQHMAMLHNALLVKQKKEAMLIEEWFNANKIAKKRLREERARRLTTLRGTYERETYTLTKMIEQLRHMAEVAGIFVGDTVTDTSRSAVSPRPSQDQAKAGRTCILSDPPPPPHMIILSTLMDTTQWV